MREFIVPALVLLSGFQTTPAAWKTIQDSKGLCRISVPAEWTPMEEKTGAAVFESSTTAIAVVTSQPEQAFKPLTDSMQKLLGIRKDKVFENTVKRTFYQDKVSRNAEDSSAFSASVPGKTGTCSCRITVLPSITEETARKIALSLGTGR